MLNLRFANVDKIFELTVLLQKKQQKHFTLNPYYALDYFFA